MASVAERAKKETVKEVRIGLGYTAVLLEGEHAGVAYTFRNEARESCTVFEKLRPLRGRQASDLVALLVSSDRTEAAVGLACINALANRDYDSTQKGDILALLDVRSEDDVAMVGQFRPLIGPLKDRARSLTVFERIVEPQGEIRPADEAKDVLPQCQVALITATSIINHTIDELLDWAKACREIVLLGASTPLLPDVFSGRVTMLSGSVVEEPAEVLRIVSEGGGMRLFGPHVQKVCFRPELTTTALDSSGGSHA
jgi:uncharacterized protein (DUF4213/DUF364 family)